MTDKANEELDPTATGPVPKEDKVDAPVVDVSQTYVSVRKQLLAAADKARPGYKHMWVDSSKLENIGRHGLVVVTEGEAGLVKKSTEPVQHRNSTLCSMPSDKWVADKAAREGRSLKKLNDTLYSKENKDRGKNPRNVERKHKPKTLADLPEN